VHDIGVHDDRPYFVMDFVPGGTLAERVKARVSGDEALRLASESARAVQVLHDEGVLHRDVKPSNLLMDDAGRVLISDLGSAKRVAEASGVTVTTGTPAYMAPEQARGESVDPRCDVYSLGAVAYELISGRLPFDGADTASLLDRSAASRPVPVGGRDLPRSVDRVLSSALATSRDDRPASPAALADALDRVATGQSVRDVRRVRREVRPVVVLVLALVLFAASAAATWYLLQR
jgi:serine/threonine protein kinase